MIKIERKITDKSQKAISSLSDAKKRKSDYNTPEVNAALKEMFHGKCYICENKKATSYNIEHLLPHKGDLDLKYDWDNLLWSCAHCNNIKLHKYDPILDCTKYAVDELIAFRKHGYFGMDEVLVFEPLDTSEAVINTANLLREVYYGCSSQKQIEAVVIRRELRNELSKFKEYVRKYYEEDEGEDKTDLLHLIKRELGASSPFAAFKRWLIKDYKDYYSEIAVLLPNGQ